MKRSYTDLSQALRTNLLKRKAQTKGRLSQKEDVSEARTALIESRQTDTPSSAPLDPSQKSSS